MEHKEARFVTMFFRRFGHDISQGDTTKQARADRLVALLPKYGDRGFTSTQTVRQAAKIVYGVLIEHEGVLRG